MRGTALMRAIHIEPDIDNLHRKSDLHKEQRQMFCSVSYTALWVCVGCAMCTPGSIRKQRQRTPVMDLRMIDSLSQMGQEFAARNRRRAQ